MKWIKAQKLFKFVKDSKKNQVFHAKIRNHNKTLVHHRDWMIAVLMIDCNTLEMYTDFGLTPKKEDVYLLLERKPFLPRTLIKPIQNVRG